MPGVWKGFLSVQNSCCPQNITHAGQGAQTSQDKVRASSSINGDTIKQNLVTPAKKHCHSKATETPSEGRGPLRTASRTKDGLGLTKELPEKASFHNLQPRCLKV